MSVEFFVFTDTETTGLDFGEDEIWNIHMKIMSTGSMYHHAAFDRLVTHDIGKIKKLPQNFQDLHAKHYIPEYALSPVTVGEEIQEWIARFTTTQKVHFVAANPTFDAVMMMANLMTQAEFYAVFDYHLIDIESFALGWLRCQEVQQHRLFDAPFRKNIVPFKADRLTEELGVDTGDLSRHTAEGDVEWMKRIWKRMNLGQF